jgi:hypothetical protein
MTMNHLRIRLHEGSVIIEQNNSPGTLPSTILLQPEQLPLVIEWLEKIQRQSDDERQSSDRRDG